MSDPETFSQGEVDQIIEKKKLKFNDYATQKSVAQNVLNTTIIQNNIQTLVSAVAGKTINGFETAAITLTVISLCIQIIIFILVIFLMAVRTDFKIEVSEYKVVKAKHLNMSITFFSGISLAINIAISIVVSYT